VRIEETRRFGLSRKQVYEYVSDPKTWTSWVAGLIDVTDLDQARWQQPGDQIALGHRLLGHRIETHLELDEIQPAQYARFHATAPAVGTATHEWFYSDAGESSSTLRVVCETGEPPRIVGENIDPTVVPRALERDLKTSIGNLEQIFANSIPDAVPTALGGTQREVVHDRLGGMMWPGPHQSSKGEN